MSTNFGSAGIPGTRLKVCVWWGGGWWGGSHTQYRITPVPRLGAGALMLNAWDWTVTIFNFSFHDQFGAALVVWRFFVLVVWRFLFNKFIFSGFVHVRNCL